MAGQFDLPSWLTTQTPWSGSDAFIKGSQAGAAIAANRIRAKALYMDAAQTQQKLDLAERDQVTRDEASRLHNEVVRTKLANDAADFETLRTWWPQFQSSEGEVDMPVLRDENTMLKVATAVAEKRSKIGQAAFAELMATPGFDLATPEHQKQYFDLLSKYKNIPAKLGPDGVMGPIKVAESLKRLRDEAASRIAKNTTGTTLEQGRLDVAKGNLEARNREQAGKETRLGLRERYLNERNAIDREEKAKLKAAELDAPETDRLRKFYNLKRREVTKKFYGPEVRPGLQTEDRTTNAPPAVVAPSGASAPDAIPQFPAMPSRKEDLKANEVYITPRGVALWDGERFIPQ